MLTLMPTKAYALRPLTNTHTRERAPYAEREPDKCTHAHTLDTDNHVHTVLYARPRKIV